MCHRLKGSSVWSVLTACSWPGDSVLGESRCDEAVRALTADHRARRPGQWWGAKGDNLSPQGYLGCLPPYGMGGCPLALWGGERGRVCGATPAGEGGLPWAGLAGAVGKCGSRGPARAPLPALGDAPQVAGAWLARAGVGQVVAMRGVGGQAHRLCIHKGRPAGSPVPPHGPQAPGHSGGMSWACLRLPGDQAA